MLIKRLLHTRSWFETLSKWFTKFSSTLGNTRSLSIAVPSPTGRRIFPRRIDLGKNKYGGPFTNEEVEDTKTFLRILPLLLCLFWIPSSRKWLLSSRTAPEDQLSFTTSTATDYIQSTPLEHSCLSSWYTHCIDWRLRKCFQE